MIRLLRISNDHSSDCMYLSSIGNLQMSSKVYMWYSRVKAVFIEAEPSSVLYSTPVFVKI